MTDFVGFFFLSGFLLLYVADCISSRRERRLTNRYRAMLRVIEG